eukprot:RCo029001
MFCAPLHGALPRRLCRKAFCLKPSLCAFSSLPRPAASKAAAAELRKYAKLLDEDPEKFTELARLLPPSTRRAVSVTGAAKDFGACVGTVDTDRDGHISEHEFLSWMRTTTAVQHSMCKAQAQEDKVSGSADSSSSTATSSSLPTAAPAPAPAPPPSTAGARIPIPGLRQLALFAASVGIPFVGFGFMDNTLMIVSGEMIDRTVGAALGLSVLASAALGNIISDCSGVMLGDAVEAAAAHLGLPPHNLTSLQHTLTLTRLSAIVGSMLGVTLGCLLGMFPLLFMNTKSSSGGDASPSPVATSGG